MPVTPTLLKPRDRHLLRPASQCVRVPVLVPAHTGRVAVTKDYDDEAAHTIATVRGS
jgi:hypothetical protein